MSGESEKFDKFWKTATIATLILMVIGFFIVIGLYIKYKDKIDENRNYRQQQFQLDLEQ